MASALSALGGLSDKSRGFAYTSLLLATDYSHQSSLGLLRSLRDRVSTYRAAVFS